MPIQLPKHILDAVKNGKTSLGEHPCFPPENEDKFAVALLKRRFEDLSEVTDGFTTDELKKKLNRYITKVQKIEEEEKGALESICTGLINELFNIPQDTIHIEPHLVNKVDVSDERLRPESTDDFEFDDIESMNHLTEYIYKRRLLNALAIGASAYYANDVSLYESELASINPDLPLLYQKINACNDYLLFTEKDCLPSDEKKYTDAGTVKVYINGTIEQPRINAYGITFPVMLLETIKGLLEIACTYGLPDRQKDAEFVMKKADFKLAENWDLRLGYPLWERVVGCFEKVNIDPLEIGLNFIFKEMAEKPYDEFNAFFQEVFAQTHRGKMLISELVDRIEEEKERDDFDNYMTDKASEFHQINDSIEEYDYFTPEELVDDEYLVAESIEEKIANAEKEVDTNPSEKQKEAGNYKMGHVIIDGFKYTIENPKGSYRKGVDPNGKHWSCKMNNTYGYIRGAKSVDGDEIDMYLSDKPTEGNIYVIDQVNKDGTFDEHKVMYGFNSYEEAKENYLANFEKGWTGLGKITEVSKEDFKKWVRSSYRKRKPFSEYVKIAKLGTTKGRRKLKESVDDDIWYRGYDPQYGVFDNGENYTWLTTDREYAEEYGKSVAVCRVALNGQKWGSILSGPEEMDYYNPSSEEMERYYFDEGIVGYIFYANDDESECCCVNKDNVKVIETYDVGDSEEYIHEHDGELLMESQESESIKKAKELVVNMRSCSPEKADNFVRITIRETFPPLRSKKGGKFILGVTRMFLNNDFIDGSIISKLNTTLGFVISDAHYNEYDRNLNGLSASELIDKFKSTVGNAVDADRENLGNTSFTKANKYRIVPINSFEEAEKYYKYTNPNSRWCLTYLKDMYDTYTSNGINQIYFCFKKGFKLVRRVAKSEAPLDEYGLSMISVIVDADGGLAYCTSRWNHDNGGNDSVMDTKQISEVIGQNFYDVFKPNNKWNESVEDMMIRLGNGESPMSIFDYCGRPCDGLMRVKLGEIYNYVDEDNNLLSKQWYTFCEDFSDGLGRIQVNNYWNFINTDGYLLSKQWFNWCGPFIDDVTNICIGNKWNYIDRDGKLISQQWFDRCGDFDGEVMEVLLNKKVNFINRSGKLLSDHWFDFAGSFSEGFAAVELNKKWNYIDRKGNLLSQQWFDRCIEFKEGFAAVKLGEKWNCIGTDGKLLSPQWFDRCGYFTNGFNVVKLDGKWNYISKNGRLVSPQWFDKAFDFNDMYARVKIGDKWEMINKKGEIFR